MNKYNNDHMNRVHSADGICPALTAVTGGGRAIKIIDNTKKGYAECEQWDSITLTQPTSKTRRARVQKGITSALTTDGRSIGIYDGYMIRYLTELEYWRLQEYSDEQFYAAAEVCTKTQLYKIAGNAMNVKVLNAIFSELLLKKQPKMPILSHYDVEVIA